VVAKAEESGPLAVSPDWEGDGVQMHPLGPWELAQEQGAASIHNPMPEKKKMGKWRVWTRFSTKGVVPTDQVISDNSAHVDSFCEMGIY
jgi:hypothetical protein